MKIKSRLFEIMQLCSLHSVLLFLYISVLLKRNFLKKKERIPGFLMHCHICETLVWKKTACYFLSYMLTRIFEVCIISPFS